MTLYQSKPQMVEAVQWRGDNADECLAFCGEKLATANMTVAPMLALLAGKDGAQGSVHVPVGHWLVNQPGDKSDVWPVDPDYFAAKYEPLPS